jgi:hypothetical protein
MSQERLNDELAAIEAALCSLSPAHSGIERDRLMFLAGKKAAMNRRTPKLLLAMATAASLLAAATFGTLWVAGNQPRLVERPVVVAAVGTSIPVEVFADASPPSPWENRRLCQLVLEKGIDGLPQPSRRRISSVLPMPAEETYRSLLKQFLDNPTG